MAKRRTANERLKIAMDALQYSYRTTADIHGLSEAGVRKILNAHLRTLFYPAEVAKCSNISDYRRLFNGNYGVGKQKSIPDFKPVTPEIIRKNIKASARHKTSEEIATSFNIMGIKNFQDGEWDSDQIREVIDA